MTSLATGYTSTWMSVYPMMNVIYKLMCCQHLSDDLRYDYEGLDDVMYTLK